MRSTLTMTCMVNVNLGPNRGGAPSAASSTSCAPVAVGAETVRAYERITADVCFLGIWSLHPDAGITGRYREEAEVRRVMVERADRVVGLTTRDKLGTVSAFASAPAAALTHPAVEPHTPEEQLAPFRELGIAILS